MIITTQLMETKQTAVQWLEENLAEKLKYIVETRNFILMENLFGIAKSMEKEQIKKAYKDCHDLGHIYGLDLEEYYNETYGTSR